MREKALLGGVDDTASRVGVVALLPAGAAVAVEGEQTVLAPTVVAAQSTPSTVTTTAAALISIRGDRGCCRQAACDSDNL
jgi:hypothetical protein